MTTPTEKPPSPVALLQMQVNLLERIEEAEAAQQQMLEDLALATRELSARVAPEETVVAERPVRLSGLDVPFLSLVGFLIKLALASLPAAVILWLIFALIGLLVALLFGIPLELMGSF